MEIVVRAAVIFLFLWLLTRALGKRELAELTAFELVVLVVMGDLIQQGVTQEDMSVTGAMIAVGTFGLLVLLFSWVDFRWPAARGVLNGRAEIVVREGVPLMDVLKVERVTLDDLLEAARNQGIADLREVRIGVLEPDGKFSFLRYDESQPSHQDELPI